MVWLSASTVVQVIPRDGLPLIIAHRGASADAPENTVAAADLAWKQGADAVEVDLRLTRDGQIVVLHDATTRRTAGVNLSVARTPLGKLRALDAGSSRGTAWRGEPIPTLSEVLATVPAGRQIVLELKVGGELFAPLARDLAAAAAAGGPGLDRVILIAFAPEVARAAKARFSAARVLLLADLHQSGRRNAGPAIRRLIADAHHDGLDGLDVSAPPGLDAGVVAEIHAAGLALFVWTVNEPARAVELMRAGVDGITTDQPAALLAAREPWPAVRT